MNDTDWQARALEVAREITPHGYSVTHTEMRILAFAQAYAAEVTAEVERLRLSLKAKTKIADDFMAENEISKSTIDDLRAQLAAGPVKVPEYHVLYEIAQAQGLSSATVRAVISNFLRLNAAPPENKP